MEIQEGNAANGLVTAGGAVVGVQTEGGRVDADKVVVAVGSWAGRFFRDLDIELPVEPVKGQMLLFKTEPGFLSRIVLEGNRYVIPRSDGHILVGATMERVGFDKTTSDTAKKELQGWAFDRVPELASKPLVKHWAGLRPGSPSGVPYIGKVSSISGCYVNGGHFRNGVVLGLGSARLLASLVLGTTLPLAAAPYQVA